ncbi:MAG: hypothetical protein ABR501_05660 [Pyrinomonadaceae bacterium]
MLSKLFDYLIVLCVLVGTLVVQPTQARRTIAARSPATRPAADFGKAVESQPRVETRVYVRKQCILSEFDFKQEQKNGNAAAFPAALAIFVPILIEKGLGAVSAALKKAGAAETLKDSGRLPTYLYHLARTGQNKGFSLNPNLGCVLVVRGSFTGPDPEDISKINFTRPGIFVGDDDQSENNRLRRLHDARIPVSEISSLYEAAIKTSNDKTALYYEGRFLEVNAFQGSRSSNSRSMVVSLTIYAPGAKEGESVLSLALVNLGDVKKGLVLGPQDLRSQRSSWLGGLGISEGVLTAIGKLQPDPNKPNDPLPVMPVTVEGMFVETDKGSKALQFIAEVLDASKADLSKAAKDEIARDPKKEAAAAEDAVEKLRLDEETAYAACLTAQQAYVADQNNALKKFNVQTAHRLWTRRFSALTTIGQAVDGNRNLCTFPQ